MINIDSIKNIEGLRFEHLKGNEKISGGKIDSRVIERGDLYFCLKGRFSDGHEFIKSALDKGAVAAVVDKNYENKSSYPVIYAENVELAMGDIARAYRENLKAKLIVITGSNGKTTTKEMIYSALSLKYKVTKTEGNLNNFQGLPLSIFSIKDDDDYAVLEIGSNNFGEIKYLTDIAKPDYGLITNIGDAHLQNFGDRKGVLREKIELLNGVKHFGGTFFLNCDDPFLKDFKESYFSIVTYGCGDYDYSFKPIGSEISLSVKLELSNGETFDLGSIGRTSIYNGRAAYSVLSFLGLSNDFIKIGLKKFTHEGFRQNLKKVNSINIVLDCYNANPTSMKESINNLSSTKKKSLILGDMLELGSREDLYHKDLAKIINPKDYTYIVLIGKRMESLFKSLKGDNVEWFSSVDLSKDYLRSLNFKGETLLIKGSRSIGLETIYNDIFKGE